MADKVGGYPGGGRAEDTGPPRPVPSASARSDTDVMQDDLAAILRELGLGDHARPQSPHQVVHGLVLPMIRAWRMALEAAGVPTTAEHEAEHRRMDAAFRRAAPEQRSGERWRVGTSEGTDGLTLYRPVPDGPVRGRLVGMVREPEDAELVCNAVNHWLAAEHRWEYGVEGRWPDGGINLDWRGSREDAEDVLAARAEIPGNVVVSRLVRRLRTTGPVEEVPDADT